MRELTFEEFESIFVLNDAYEHMVKYYDEIVTDVLSDYFELKKCENKHIWYSDWENHRRKVIKLYAQKGTSYTIRWGYNYDFIPDLNRQGKFVYRRTDKAVGYDVYDDFYEHIQYNSDNLSLRESYDIRRRYSLPVYTNDIAIAKEYIKDIVRKNIPFMLEWYEQNRTDHQVIQFINRLVKEGKASLTNFEWVKAFLHARYDEMDEALGAMQGYYRGREIPPKVIERLIMEGK